jgi:hypothetical protein
MNGNVQFEARYAGQTIICSLSGATEWDAVVQHVKEAFGLETCKLIGFRPVMAIAAPVAGACACTSAPKRVSTSAGQSEAAVNSTSRTTTTTATKTTLTPTAAPGGKGPMRLADFQLVNTGCNSQTSHFNKTRPAQRLHATTRKKLAKCDHRQSVMPGQ